MTSEAQLKAAIEAVLMVVEEPVTVDQLSTALQQPGAHIMEMLKSLKDEYDGVDGQPARGFELRQVAGGWRVYARAEHSDVLERFMVQGATTRLSQAALEALAVIAYQQPASRGKVAQIRGVNSDSVIRTLHARGLIEESGVDPLTQAVLYATTPYFLEMLGLQKIEDLPNLSPLLPGAADAAQFADEL